jgi:hypothetical protein
MMKDAAEVRDGTEIASGWHVEDDGFRLYHSADTTRVAKFDVSRVSAGGINKYTLPSAGGVLALTTDNTLTGAVKDIDDTSWVVGDIAYCGSAGSLERLAGNGAAGKALRSNGNSAGPSWGPTVPTRQAFSSAGTHTWTKPSGCRKVLVRVIGGGGGGGGGSGANAYAGGGGSGGYSEKLIDVTAISSETVTVGAAGTAGTSSNGGGDGGASSFGSHATGNGGGGGVGTTVTGAGKAGGTASDGDINVTGGAGGDGGDGTAGAAGNGGYGAFGGGGKGGGQVSIGGVNAGAAGSAGGGGGGGTNASGGAGGAGLVIVEEFY